MCLLEELDCKPGSRRWVVRGSDTKEMVPAVFALLQSQLSPDPGHFSILELECRPKTGLREEQGQHPLSSCED